jgi:predicted butyrate kinase (DUF1464 family)
MPRVIGIDPGTVSIDLCGLDGSTVWLDRSLPTHTTLQDPGAFLELLRSAGPVDLIAGPSGYGLPLVSAGSATPDDIRLAFLPDPAGGGLGGLTRLARLLIDADLPLLYTPGVIHLPTVPRLRKQNRIDLGTADKVALAALAIWDQIHRATPAENPAQASLILLELGGAFTAALAVDQGQIVDGIGGTGGPPGWMSGGAWDGEVAWLAGPVTKAMLFRGGPGEHGVPGTEGLETYIEGAVKAVLALTASVPKPREVLLSGRHARDAEIRGELERRLQAVAPVRHLTGFAREARQGAQGAALLADGLAGGAARQMIDQLRLRDAAGTTLDYLTVITPDEARRRLGLGASGN